MNNELKRYIISLLDKGIRLDGRKLTEYRKPIKVEYVASENAEGSCRVRIGKTEVITGVKLSLETPYPDTPDQGCLMVGAEFLPIANPEFEPGPPSIRAVEIGRVIDRGIRESKAIDMKKLCIKEKEQSFGVSIDICTINDDGNLFDAAALSAIAALKDTKMPKLDEGVILYAEKTKEKLPLKKLPISVTVCKIGNHLIIDPDTEEEKVIDARLTVATAEDGVICALQKGGTQPLSIEEIDSMVGLGIEKCAELRKHL